MSRHETEDLLESSPFDDDLSEVLAAHPARAGTSKLTLALAGAVLLVAGVLLGIQAHKHFGGTASGTRVQSDRVIGGDAGGTAASATGGTSGARARGGFGAGFPGRTGGGGQATYGTVQRVDGDTIYVQTASGEVVTVRTGANTKIQVSRPGKAEDLKPGATVAVSGTRAADGTVDATSVREGSLPGRRTS